MRILIWPLLAATLVFGGISGAQAQQDGGPPQGGASAWSSAKCAAAHASASREAIACIGSANRPVEEKYEKLLYDEAHRRCEEVVDYWQHNACVSVEKTRLWETWRLTFLQEISSARAGCVSSFDRQENDLQQYCGRNSTNPLHCAERNAVIAVCACGLRATVQCANPKSTQRAVLANIGCQHIVDDAKACNNACGSDAECQNACAARRNAQMATCFPPAVVEPKPLPSPRSRDSVSNPKRATVRTSTASAKAATSKVIPAKNNNLDRFDLGPTFVSPDASASGSKTTVRRTATSKTGLKGTTSTDAVTVAPQIGGATATAPKVAPK